MAGWRFKSNINLMEPKFLFRFLPFFLNTPVFPGTQSEFRLRVPFRSLHPMSLHGVFVFPSDDLFCVCVSTDPSLGLCLESQGPH